MASGAREDRSMETRTATIFKRQLIGGRAADADFFVREVERIGITPFWIDEQLGHSGPPSILEHGKILFNRIPA
jgi:hypothetical protein